MDNKLNNMINEFLANVDVKTQTSQMKNYKNFTKIYNAGEIEYENTVLDDAYELLEKAENAKSKKQAIKYAKKHIIYVLIALMQYYFKFVQKTIH